MTQTTPTAAPGAAEFQKRPVNIWAIQWTGENLDAVMLFCAGNATYELTFRDNSEIVIATLEDGGDKVARHVADKGDWIIRGIKGEFYPCKPDIFEATYAAPPPPVGELQGVTDRAVGDALQSWYAMRGYSDLERMRAALESFAASRPVAEAGPLSKSEQEAVLKDPKGIACLLDRHDCWIVEADARDIDECIPRHEARLAELLALGRAIIAEDPECFTDEQKEPFKLRYSETTTKAGGAS